MTHILTRPARWADLTDIQAMITALASFHGDDAKIDIATLNRDAFGAAPWIHLSVAEKDNSVVGYVAMCPLVQLQYGTRGMDLHHIYVEAPHRGRGVARALISHAAARSRGMSCGYMMVGTSPENTAAKATYTACGFAPTAHNENRFYMDIA